MLRFKILLIFCTRSSTFSGYTCCIALVTGNIIVCLHLPILSQWHKLERRQASPRQFKWELAGSVGALPGRWHNCECVSSTGDTTPGAGWLCWCGGREGQRSGLQWAIIIRHRGLGLSVCVSSGLLSVNSAWIVKTRNCTKLRVLISRKWGLYLALLSWRACSPHWHSPADLYAKCVWW